MQFQRTPLLVTLDQHRLTLSVHREGAGGSIRVGVGDEVHELSPGDVETFELASPLAAGGRRPAARRRREDAV